MVKFKLISEDKNVYKEYTLFNYITLVFILMVLLFFYGFFPMYYNENIVATREDIPTIVEQTRIKVNEIYKPAVKKVIIMMIDALRWDFVAGIKSNDSLPLAKNLLYSGKGCLYKTKVHPPTVTMPRIKAITTGSVPNFVDVVLNINAGKILSDSLLKQTNDTGYKTIFYGDDTWLKLFPDMFYRNETTSSFFVSDFVEVDTNVTRNLDIELKKNDWSIMILHYLGLDHIGHLHGPNSPLIKPKLNEMDQIIGRIESYAFEMNKNNTPTLFLVMGDHGMKDSGSHGGATLDETLVAMMSFGTPCKNKRDSEDEVDQIDITSTLSVLLGIPIPKTNLGSLILELLINLTDSQKLFALHYNAEQLFLQFKKNENYMLTETYRHYKKVVEQYSDWLNSKDDVNLKVDEIILNYQKVILEIKGSLMRLFKYDVGIMSLALTILCLVLYVISSTENFALKLSFSRFFDFVKLSYVLYMALILTLEFKIDFSILSKALDSNNYPFKFCIIAIFLTNCFFCCTRGFSIKLKKDINELKYLLIIGSALHTFSLGSTSFIEEEHQTWYFLWITILLYLCCSVFTNNDKKGSKKLLVALVLTMLGHRVLRKLNSTGVEYASLPDISDWLQKRDGNFEMTLVLLLGLMSLVYLDFYWERAERRKTALYFDSLIAILIYLRHAASKTVFKPEFFYESQGVIEVYCFWACLSIYFIDNIRHLITSVKNKKSNFITQLLFLMIKKWVIVSCLLHRPYNVILLPAQLAVGMLIHHLTRRAEDVDCKLYLYMWSSSVFHFYQGNSNSLASVDLAAGYVGLETYRPVIIGIFLSINTYSAMVLGFLMYLADNALQQIVFTPRILLALIKRYAFWRVVPMTFYMVLLSYQRYHLSIWTVFSPKLLYEAMHTCVLFFVMFIVQITFLPYYLITRK